MKIIVGLGNPGPAYCQTRHNIGFRVVDRLGEQHHISLQQKRFHACYGKGSIRSVETLLIKPLTYMNLSGVSVKKVLDFFKLGPESLIVVQDDLDLPFGRFRFKQRGGDGGHQGIRSILESLGGTGFIRLKIGIGRPPAGQDPADYVLTPFDKIESAQLEAMLRRAAEALVCLLTEGLATAMNRYQGKPNPPSQSP